MRKIIVSLALLATTFQGALAAQPQAATKLPDLVGTWSYVGGERDGAKLDADHFQGQTVIISDTQIRLTGDQLFEFDYELAAGEPTKIDLTITKSPFGAGMKTVGIVAMKDGEFSLCYDSSGQDRPDAFESAAGSSNLFFKLKRQPVEAEKLVGSWKLVRGLKNGESLAEDRLSASSLEVSKESFTLASGEKFVMTYKLDAKANPPSIDFTMTDSPFGAGATAPGIVQQLGEKQFILCYAPTGGDRPAGFASTKETPTFLFVWEKK